MSIKRNKLELKVKITIFIFLIAFLSYGIGYLMGKDTNRTAIVIERQTQN